MKSFSQLESKVELRLCHSLSNVLRDGIDIHRCLAAQALGQVRSEGSDAVDALIDALRDEDEDVRADAAGALARLGDPKSGAHLLENLIGDPCADVKLPALDALIRMCHPKIVPWLQRLLAGRDEEIVWDDDAFHADEWDDWTDLQLRALSGLAELGVEAAVPEIVAAIDDEFGQDLLEPGFAALARLGEPGIAALDNYFETGDPKKRRRVAKALGTTRAGAASPVIGRALADTAPEVRLAAARAIAARDPADDRLPPLFSDDEAELRAEMVRLCGRAHPEQLRDLLNDSAPVVQQAIFDVLADAPEIVPADAVLEPLHAALNGSDGNLAVSAANALAAVAPDEAADTLCALMQNSEQSGIARAGAAKALARIGGDAAEIALVTVIGEPDRSLRLAAMTGLLGDARTRKDWPNVAGDALLAALRGELVPAPEAEEEPQPEPAVEADTENIVDEPPPAPPTSTLEAILGSDAYQPAQDEGSSASVELTQQDIDRLALAKRTPRKKRVPIDPKVAPYKDVRRIAARLLGDLAHEDVACALAEMLEDEDTDVRLAATDSLARVAEGLGWFPDLVTERLTAAVANGDHEVRLSGIRALGAAGGTEAESILRKFLRHEDSFVRTEAVRALSRSNSLGGVAVELMSDPDRNVRLTAAEAVATTGGDDAVDHLIEFAFSFGGEHRIDAGRLLRDVDASTASTRFLDVLDRPERARDRRIAIDALMALNKPRSGGADTEISGSSTGGGDRIS